MAGTWPESTRVGEESAEPAGDGRWGKGDGVVVVVAAVVLLLLLLLLVVVMGG